MARWRSQPCLTGTLKYCGTKKSGHRQCSLFTRRARVFPSTVGPARAGIGFTGLSGQSSIKTLENSNSSSEPQN